MSEDIGGDGAREMMNLGLEDKAHDKAGRGGRGAKRSGRGRGGGGGAGAGAQSREVLVSKALSRLLRHKAEGAGIKLDDEGFAPLDRVVSVVVSVNHGSVANMLSKLSWGPIASLNVSFSDVQSIVTTNEKQRFSLKPNPQTDPSLSTASTSPSDWLIRANQGHSIKVDSSLMLEPVTLAAGNTPPRVLHGTYLAFWPAIVASGGLRPMARNHVHCCAGAPEDGVVRSGMRADAELLVEVEVEASLREGVRWWRSENGVLLTEGGEDGVLSTRFFKLVTGRGVDVGVLWRDGEKVADLPEGVKGKIPQGKGPRDGGRGGQGGRGGRGGRGRGRGS